MSTPFKLLLVEDNQQDADVCRSSIAAYKEQRKRCIDIVQCKSFEEAISALNNTFDGAIIDLKLANKGYQGNAVLERIKTAGLRIPTAIMTATPGATQDHFTYIGTFKKGEVSYADIFDLFWGIYNAGLTRIMGGRGVIEDSLNKVFFKNILPQKDTWIHYGSQDPARTEKALLRHTLNHLLELLDCEVETSFPEEMYIHPPVAKHIKTGTIIETKAGSKAFMVLTPPCDLAIRKNGDFKTDRILLAEIEDAVIIADVLKNQGPKRLPALFANTYAPYYHWLPQTNFFPGGFLNFRKITANTKSDFSETYKQPTAQIAPPFAKDILARFAAYYGRQGQPDIDSEALVQKLSAKK